MNRSLRCHPQWAGTLVKKDVNYLAKMRAKLMRRTVHNHPKWLGKIIKKDNGLSSKKASSQQHIRCSIKGNTILGSGTQECKNVSVSMVQLPVKDGDSGSLQINIHITQNCPCVGRMTVNLNLEKDTSM
ncbi:hypothetical protein R1flu_001761 [Riccia fluitans]|uniref:Uncharacterized protein n=1 Tax=Riccia fluitans TaxID=41844 RepID=A0ABD1Y4K2_9MARC